MACILKEVPKKDCGVIVPPGLKAFYTIPYDDITGMAATDKEVPVISKATGKKFIKIPFSRTTGAFALDYNGETEDSDTILNEFSLFCPQLKPALHAALEAMINVDMTAVGKTGDGAMLISGDADDPIKLVRIQGGTGTPEAGQKNGYTLTFRRPNSSSLPNFYTGAEADLLVAGE